MTIRRLDLMAAASAVALIGGGALAYHFLWRPIDVSVASAEANVPIQVFGLGTVGARIQSSVGFKVGGVLISLKADQGDRVKAGQDLADLDARDIEAQLAVAKAGVAQARANIEKAKADVKSATATLANTIAMSARRSSLAEKGFASVETAETNVAAVKIAEAGLASAQSGIAVAEAALQSAEAQEAYQAAVLANYTLRAPYDAWIVTRNLELGSAANPGQPVFTLVAAHTVWVLAYVDERLAGRLAVGQPAVITLRSNPAVAIPGHVERIEIQSDAVNEERLVDVAFDAIPDDIHLAEQAEVVITTGRQPSAVLVHAAAITGLQKGRGTVWTVENGRLAQRSVVLGPQLLDGRYPILDGLPPAAQAVDVARAGLRAGRTVSIAEAARP